MKKLFSISAAIIIMATALSSCGDDGNSWTDYKEWREANNNWYPEQLQRTNPDGTPYYTLLSPAWSPKSGVLIHYFNDRSLTAANLSPMLTSKVTVKYRGHLYNGVGFDSTTVDSDSVRTFPLSGTIGGWKIALQDMHVGDTCEIIVPYGQGYGSQGSTNISAYSALQFNIRLTDIPAYEIP